MNRQSTNHTVRSQHGMVVVFVAIALISLMLVCGLAVDGGRLYLTQARLQRAVDAGVTAGMFLLSRRDLEFVRSAAQAQVETNLKEMGVAYNSEDLDIVASPSSLSISGEVDVSLYLVSVVPGIGPTQKVFASAKGERPRLQVALVLDTSFSMAGKPIEDLKAAAINFLHLLNPAVDDRIAVITYNSTGAERVLHSLSEPLDNLAEVESEINAIAATGNTCMSCGARLAIDEFTADGTDDALQFVILMTDGRPTQPGNGTYSRCGWNVEPAAHVANFRHYILETRSAINQIRMMGIPVYTIGLGRRANYGPIQCQNNEYNASKAEQPGPVDQSGDGVPDCFWCTGPTAFHYSTEVYPNQPNNPNTDYKQWCGGDLMEHFLIELANDATNTDPALVVPTAPGFVPPSLGSCQDSAAGDCGCHPRLGDNYPKGKAVFTENSEELTDLFESILRISLDQTRLVE